jgi:beta-galactosidase
MRLRTAVLLLWSGAALLAQTRLRENFNAGWLFARQTQGTGELGSFERDNRLAGRVEPRFVKAVETAYDDSGWQSITLPHTWNAHDSVDQKAGYWRGIGWYRKHFRLDPKYAAKRIFLEFEGVNHVAEFWLNGRALGTHKGGYTGFEFDITEAARFDADNVLAVKVDNLYHDTIPPTVKTDYTFYGGIYRYVWLRISEPVYLSDAHWTTPTVSAATAEVAVETVVTNRSRRDARLEVEEEIFDPGGRLVESFAGQAAVGAGKSASVFLNSGTVANPQLWEPSAPRLYRIRTSIREGEALLDQIETPLGFRWYRFDPKEGFFLNGKRVQIQGVNWHQSYPGMGNALPKSRHWSDMEVIRDMGANFWRTSHYPHDTATIEASDRLGLMVWEELPVNKEIGDPKEYIANVSNMAREMIGRDRNHPSVILWGIAGEINAPEPVARQVVGAVARLYREIDPTRPVVMHAPRSNDIEALVDVVGLDAGPETDAKHTQFPNRPYMTGEYSLSLSGRGIYGAEPNSDEEAAAKHEQHLAELNLRPWMAGGAIWHMFDYDGETYDAVTPHVVAFGMADIWRIPKEPYYFYQSQWSERPMVHIVGHWTWPGEEGRTRRVKVYSNADEVELLLNGRSLGKQGIGKYPGLEHPPRTWEVPYQAGTLRAVARIGSQEIADERKTAGPAYQILLSADRNQLNAGDPDSLAYITAVVADREGVPVPDAAPPIAFTWYGPGELLEQTWPPYGTGLAWNAVAGITRIAFRAGPGGRAHTGTAMISASSAGLRTGRLRIRLTAPGKPDEMQFREFQ